MSSFVRILIHVTFHTKENAPWLTSEVETELLPFLGQILLKLDSKLVQGGCNDDHIHLLVELPASLAIEEMMRRIKGASSHWIHRRWPELKDAGWQHGYGAFSVDYEHPERLIAYIQNQRNHHGSENR